MIEQREHKIFYGYVVAASAFIIQMVAFGMYVSYSVFFNSFLVEFAWSRALISGAFSVCFFAFGLLGVFAGRLNDRIGPRIVMTACGIFLALGYALMSQVHSVWQLYLVYSSVIAIGFSGMDVSTLSTIVRWFDRKRGMMSGVIKVGAGVGILVMPLAATSLISSYGWRTAYVIIAGIVLLFVVSASQFLKRDPSQLGLLPDGDEKKGVEQSHWEEIGFSLHEAVRTRQFWMLCTMYLLFGFCSQIVLVHAVPHALDLGTSPTTAASVLSIVGGVSIAGRFILGSASDKIGNKSAHIICFAFITAAFLSLSVAEELWALYLFAVLYGFAHGGLWAMISPIVAEMFGLGSHGAIFGVVFFSCTVGGTAGPVLAGYIFDITGSYQPVFFACVAFSILTILLALLLTLTGQPQDPRRY
ncbi:MFS transporter [Chloroflexota bacterium]